MSKSVSTVDLYTPKEVQKVREKLLDEQENIDAVTGLEIPNKQAVLDHCHNTQHVRAVLHRQTNAALGKIENLWVRYLKHWYPYDLPTFLRQCADYLEKPPDGRYFHPGWIKRLTADFNKLSVKEQTQFLELIGAEGKPTNPAQRKLLLKKTILTRKASFDRMRLLLRKVSDGN